MPCNSWHFVLHVLQADLDEKSSTLREFGSKGNSWCQIMPPKQTPSNIVVVFIWSIHTALPTEQGQTTSGVVKDYRVICTKHHQVITYLIEATILIGGSHSQREFRKVTDSSSMIIISQFHGLPPFTIKSENRSNKSKVFQSHFSISENLRCSPNLPLPRYPSTMYLADYVCYQSHRQVATNLLAPALDKLQVHDMKTRVATGVILII